MSTPRRPAGWELAHVLAESTRRRVFEAVRVAAAPLTRDEVAEAAGLNRRLATFHLDRLAASGVLLVDYARPAGRPAGPGAGRPAKRYRAAPVQLDLSVPQRSYDLAARVLAAGIVSAPADAEAGAMRAAREEGLAVGAAAKESVAGSSQRSRGTVRARVDALCTALAGAGYEPRPDRREAVRMGNCPFRSVADLAPQLVCAMNREFVAGIVDGAELAPADVELEPQPPPNCCVTVTVRPR